jgi:hypothetical protein
MLTSTTVASCTCQSMFAWPTELTAIRSIERHSTAKSPIVGLGVSKESHNSSEASLTTAAVTVNPGPTGTQNSAPTRTQYSAPTGTQNSPPTGTQNNAREQVMQAISQLRLADKNGTHDFTTSSIAAHSPCIRPSNSTAPSLMPPPAPRKVRPKSAIGLRFGGRCVRRLKFQEPLRLLNPQSERVFRRLFQQSSGASLRESRNSSEASLKESRHPTDHSQSAARSAQYRRGTRQEVTGEFQARVRETMAELASMPVVMLKNLYL